MLNFQRTSMLSWLATLLVGLTQARLSNKIDPDLVTALQNPSSSNPINITVIFQGGNQAAIQSYDPATQQPAQLLEALKNLASSSQQNAINFLQYRYPSQSSGVTYKQFWISNQLCVQNVNWDLVNSLAALSEVSKILQEPVVTLDCWRKSAVAGTPGNFDGGDISSVANTLGWNLDKIKVSQAWGLLGGRNGQGIVVANIDSCVRRNHEALRSNYRGEYGWYDMTTTSTTEEPYDDRGHGTHCMGTMAGSHGIGVAPGAQWMACKACTADGCRGLYLQMCAEWMVKPTQRSSDNWKNGDINKSPNVISNSWSLKNVGDSFNDMINSWIAFGIMPVFSIGNTGPECGTAKSPGDNLSGFSVGATTQDDNVWAKSSAGPSAAGLVKPEISAPGHRIRSAGHRSDDQYVLKSGTSMACPHVGGVMALMLSQKPELPFRQIVNILGDTATTTGLANTGKTCGGIPSTQFPNNQYGMGRLNAEAAIRETLRTR